MCDHRAVSGERGNSVGSKRLPLCYLSTVFHMVSRGIVQLGCRHVLQVRLDLAFVKHGNVYRIKKLSTLSGQTALTGQGRGNDQMFVVKYTAVAHEITSVFVSILFRYY